MRPPATTPLRGLPLAVIDTECTGVGEDDRIVEIAVVHVTLGASLEARLAFSSRVRAPVAMSSGASRVTGITDEDLADAPVWADIDAKVRAACAGRVPVAYNSPFDHRMLLREGLDLGWPWLDAQPPAKIVDKYERRKTLEAVAARRGIVVDAHGAAGDTMATALVYEALLRECHQAGERFGQDLGELLDWTRQWALYQEADFCSYLIGKGARGTRPDCPWHELAGESLPYWPPNTDAKAHCGECGAEVVYTITKAGGVALVDFESREPHVCP